MASSLPSDILASSSHPCYALHMLAYVAGSVQDTTVLPSMDMLLRGLPKSEHGHHHHVMPPSFAAGDITALTSDGNLAEASNGADGASQISQQVATGGTTAATLAPSKRTRRRASDYNPCWTDEEFRDNGGNAPALSVRYVKNLSMFLDHVGGCRLREKDADPTVLEALAEQFAPTHMRGNMARMTSSDEELCQIHGIAQNRYRCGRARILITFAAIFEQNRRGSSRMLRYDHPCIRQQGQTSAAYQCLESGTSQAQMSCCGIDVNIVTRVLEGLYVNNLLPFDDRGIALGEAEDQFTLADRRSLVDRICKWENDMEIPPTLRMTIAESDLISGGTTDSYPVIDKIVLPRGRLNTSPRARRDGS